MNRRARASSLMVEDVRPLRTTTARVRPLNPISGRYPPTLQEPCQNRGYASASVESAALTRGRRIASGCAYERHAWTTRSRTCTMLDGERLLAPTEAAGQLGVSVRTMERLVASRPATPSNRGWLVGWSGARGPVRDVPDGAFRRHATASVRSVVAAVASSVSRPDKQGARLTTCALYPHRPRWLSCTGTRPRPAPHGPSPFSSASPATRPWRPSRSASTSPGHLLG
jgi:hypothetical protein